MGFLTSAARMWLTRSTRPFLFTQERESRLEYEKARNLGLYVHLPFCKSLCSFCPYCKIRYEKGLLQQYVQALKEEIAMVGRGGAGRKRVTSLYFGGGSPALAAEELEGIIRTVREYFEMEEGIGIELHPGDVNMRTLLLLKQAGVTRISIGVQSFQEESLRLLGREGQDFDTMWDALSKVAFETVSMDFIFALPGQTFDHLKKDIDLAFSRGANHIAMYPFIDFSFTKRGFPKPSERMKKRLLRQVTGYCASKGYVRDSIWTFAQPGTPKYSSMTRDNFLGFGCSATTLLEGSFKINTFSVPAYLEQIRKHELPTALTLHFTKRQRMLYYLFWTAYTMRVDAEGFQEFFGEALKDCYGPELLLARALGWVKKRDRLYEMTARGAYFYHYFEQFYTLSYIDRMWNLLRNTPFPKELVIR